jgi:hypothetical protein
MPTEEEEATTLVTEEGDMDSKLKLMATEEADTNLKRRVTATAVTVIGNCNTNLRDMEV